MGWDSNPEWKDYKQAIHELLKGDEILQISLRPNYAFIASKHWKHGYVYVTVARLSKSGGVIAAKLVTEFEGPQFFNPPKNLMQKLTPLDEIEAYRDVTHAREWRTEVEAYHDKPKPRTLLPGDCVRFKSPVSFNDGTTETDFKVGKLARRTIFFSRADGSACNIRGYKELEYVVLGAEDRW